MTGPELGLQGFLADLLYHSTWNSVGSNGGMTFIGSFSAEVQVTDIDRDTGQFQLNFSIENTTGWESFLHNPITREPFASDTESGWGANWTQRISWSETLAISKELI